MYSQSNIYLSFRRIEEYGNLEIKIKLKMNDTKKFENLSSIRQNLIECKASLEKHITKVKSIKNIYKLFNQPYADKNAKEYFKSISHIYNMFENELNTNTVFNETFYSKYDKHNVNLF